MRCPAKDGVILLLQKVLQHVQPPDVVQQKKKFFVLLQDAEKCGVDKFLRQCPFSLRMVNFLVIQRNNAVKNFLKKLIFIMIMIVKYRTREIGLFADLAYGNIVVCTRIQQLCECVVKGVLRLKHLVNFCAKRNHINVH